MSDVTIYAPLMYNQSILYYYYKGLCPYILMMRLPLSLELNPLVHHVATIIILSTVISDVKIHLPL